MSYESDESVAAQKAASLIHDVITERLSPDEALERWPLPIIRTNKLLERAWTDLEHFSQDDDIHAKDPEYAAARIAELQDVATQLQQGCVQYSILMRVRMYLQRVRRKLMRNR